MPLYKYIANRLLTGFQNIFLGAKLSEYHTGFRAFSKEVLQTLPLLENSDDFVFDNQILAQAVMFGFRIGEISCPTSYFEEASSIGFKRSVKYGLGVLKTTASFVVHKAGLRKLPMFDATGRKVVQKYSEIAQDREPPRPAVAQNTREATQLGYDCAVRSGTATFANHDRRYPHCDCVRSGILLAQARFHLFLLD